MKYECNQDRYDFSTDVNTEDIKQYFREHNNGPFFSIFEIGMNGIRMDLLRVDPYVKYIRGFEFKASRGDFLADNKWQQYLKYCHTFSFVCPHGMIGKEELPKGIGLLWVYKYRYRRHESGRQWIEADWARMPKRSEVDKDTLLDMAMMLTYKVIWRKHDIF